MEKNPIVRRTGYIFLIGLRYTPLLFSLSLSLPIITSDEYYKGGKKVHIIKKKNRGNTLYQQLLPKARLHSNHTFPN
jgi:hypothetical protein